MKSSTPRLSAIDGLRAMAMLMVFWYHIWEFAGYPKYALQLGTLSFEILVNTGMFAQGVDVFMVLSGFCLFFPLAFQAHPGENFNWKVYAVRRLRRIVPPYYAAIIYALGLRVGISVALMAIGKTNVWPTLPSPFDLLAHLTFTHTLSSQTFFGITGAFWSLGLEAQFYLVFPLLVWAFSRLGTRVIVGVVVISLLYHAITHSLGVGEVREVQNFFLGRWMQFAFGMSAALWVAKRLKADVKTPTWAGIALVMASLALFFVPTPHFGPWLSATALRGLVLSASVAALLCAVCTSTPPVTFLWSNRVSAFLGFVSYSFFLIHQPTMQYLAQFLKTFGPKLDGIPLFIALATFGFALCLAIAYGFFLVFEKPFLKNWPLLWRSKKAQEEPVQSS